MSYDSSCSTDSSRKSSNSSTNGSANTVGGNSRYDFKINYNVYEKLDIKPVSTLSSSSRVKTDVSEESMREIEAWEKFAREYFAGLKPTKVKNTVAEKCDSMVDNK